MPHTAEAAVAPRVALRLRFPDEELERSFWAYHFDQSLPFMRLAVVLSIVLYALFGILDAYLAPDAARAIYVIRYAVYCPLGLLVLWLSFRNGFASVAQPALFVLAVVCGLGIVGMIWATPVSVSNLYYAGLLLVLPFMYTALRLRFTYTNVAAAVILVAYEVVAIWAKHTPLNIRVNNNFFFVSSVIISMLAGYMLERGIRTAFVQRRLIEAQRAELAYHNAELDSALQSSLEEVQRKADELAASRARIVAAADAERRRIERNLHDGAQQRLVALAMRVGLVAKLVEEDRPRAEAALHELRTEVQETLQELRTLAHGIYPPLLMDRGLEAALRAAAQRSALPTMVLAEGLGRYRPETEATVYFCCLEAMQNACKHAGASASVVVNIREDRGGLRFEVIDDGAGFDAGGKPAGSGFVNMSDRLGAIGGSLEVQSAPGRGTRVIGWLPAAAEPNGHVDHAPVPGEVATPSPAG